jgi:hypothetical protein
MMLWMAVTPDDLELPMAVADSPKKLAEILKVTTNEIYMKRNSEKRGREVKDYKVRKVAYEE